MGNSQFPGAGVAAAMLLAVSQRGEAFYGAEVAGDVLGVVETEVEGDLGDRQVGFDQHPRDLVGADAADFAQNGMVEETPEASLKRPAGQTGSAGGGFD